MLLAVLASLAFGADIAWRDAQIGIKPIRSDSSTFPHQIRSLAELAATLELTSDTEAQDNSVPADSTVSRFEQKPCKTAAIDTVDGNSLSLVSWGTADSGFTLLLSSGKDGTAAIDFFHHRPSRYVRDASSTRLTWQHAGKPCERFSYTAIFDQGEFRFSPASATADFGKACKNPVAKQAFRARLERESYRRTGNRCDVMAIFPTIGYCWQDQVPQGEDDLDAP